MGQDIRELLKHDKKIPTEHMREGHQHRFMAKLEEELPKKARKFDFGWVRIAASIAIIISISVVGFNKIENTTSEKSNPVVNIDTQSKDATVILNKQRSALAEAYPKYQTIEDSFLTSIKFQLSQITINTKNKDLVESFKERLGYLDKEYQDLNNELIDMPNMQSVEAMMENLQLRLDLLNRLKNKLKELENIENEDYTDIQV